MIKLATLFSGVGAVEEAFVKMKIDFELVFACDNGERIIDSKREYIENKIKGLTIEEKNRFIEELYFKESHKQNLMQKQYCANFNVPDGHYYQDVRFLNGTDYIDDKIDLLVGGSPCQSFSIIGKRGGLEDTRGTLFYEYARIVKEAQPKVFIYENVLGMLSHDKGKTWDVIQSVFEELGYNFKVFILNSKDYGIPQDRKRIFVVGTKKENLLETPKTIELDTCVKDYLEKSVDPIFYLGEKGFKFVTNPNYKNRASVNQGIMKCQKANQQFNWNGDFIFEPIDPERHNLLVRERAYIGEYQGIKGVCRQLTPRECFRLMGFNDNYKIVVNNHMAWRQSGNAIVVNVLEAILKEIIEKGYLDD